MCKQSTFIAKSWKTVFKQNLPRQEKAGALSCW